MDTQKSLGFSKPKFDIFCTEKNAGFPTRRKTFFTKKIAMKCIKSIKMKKTQQTAKMEAPSASWRAAIRIQYVTAL